MMTWLTSLFFLCRNKFLKMWHRRFLAHIWTTMNLVTWNGNLTRMWTKMYLVPLFFVAWVAAAETTVTVGSKAFTESFILGEMAAQLLENQPDVKVVRRFGMGGTGILFEALAKNEIQIYPEYTGTISEAILKQPYLHDVATIRAALAKKGLTISKPLGFNNTYALAVPRAYARKNKLVRMSDLKKVLGTIRVGFSHEFMTRADGFPLLKNQLPFETDRIKSL
jgi:osmoprotectant transport system permease protein